MICICNINYENLKRRNISKNILLITQISEAKGEKGVHYLA
jgi:hypothetical protein